MEQKEFEDIYQEYYSRVLQYIRKRVPHLYDAEELVGDIFTNFYRSKDTYDPSRCSVSAWLYVLAGNRLKNYYRDKKVCLSVEEIDVLELSTQEDPEEIYLLAQKREELLRALETLPVRERSIIIKKYYQNKTSEEIAREMNLTPVNVRVILKRSLKKLKNAMEKRER